ncbi:hypothetical protein OM076_12670 [Solirubrobacter ginsenosidimutans]|uniref:DUF4430 domain-containing protein n=1 Tax=Solirubrobacter ginsenosidimutans TaxID=490573 RepID=A0A9X3MRJ0_9ACTN|nr:hypothetical protein [Solirubrobacter ginsenosidimutans]MDA0161125.1 hypothetical protein [Solirubrobacter ginsenosidimutans]
MKLTVIAGTVAGLLFLSAPASAAPTVTVRVEGATSTLLERTSVTLGSGNGSPCEADTAGAALDAATKGNWDKQEFVSTILGETHKFDNNDYWAEWVDKGQGYKRGSGLCADHLAEGDEVLLLVDLSPPPTFAPTVFPLAIETPSEVVNNAGPLPVTVVEYTSATGNPGEGERTPVAGATITGGDVPVVTDAAGHADVPVAALSANPIHLRATKPGAAPSATESVTFLSKGVPQINGVPVQPPATPDRSAPTAKLVGLTDRQTLKTGPRELKGSFTDVSGIKSVKLRLAKRAGGKCSYFSGKLETFRRTKCGTEKYFAIGDRADWTYLLPAKLGKGRYVLDAIAIDGAGNRTPLARGTTRVVFTVR